MLLAAAPVRAAFSNTADSAIPATNGSVSAIAISADKVFIGSVGAGDGTTTAALRNRIAQLDASNDLLLGGAGNDDLSGGQNDDRLGGGAGDDLLDELALGGHGNDRLHAGSGNDRIRTAGGTKDTIDCGPDDDFALHDSRDKQRRCEKVRSVKPLNR